jgi:putative transposase
MVSGFVYLTAVIDWYSRYVLAWQLSNSLDAHFCIWALEEALGTCRRPIIFNSDQGSQFTSKDFTKVLEAQNIQISMDGRGRAYDNIFIERLWRSVKYEEVYLKDYTDVPEVHGGLSAYFDLFNNERPHQALAYLTPAEVYLEGKKAPEIMIRGSR